MQIGEEKNMENSKIIELVEQFSNYLWLLEGNANQISMADGNLHISPPLQDPRNHNLWHLTTRARNPQPGESFEKPRAEACFQFAFLWVGQGGTNIPFRKLT